MNEIVLTEAPLTAANVQAQVNLIQEVMAMTMKNGEHYGTIPGCGDKPALLKPGAEKLCSTFRMAPEPIVEDLSDFDSARYRITCKMTSQVSGAFLGAGIGECSSNEDKYKWKRTYIDEEFAETPDDRKREKWCKGKGNKSNYQIKQIRTNAPDIANTILKMAKKRALIDAVLTITAASDIFTQDITDLPEADADTNGQEQQTQDEATISEKQFKRIFAIAKPRGMDKETIKKNLAAKKGYEGSLKDLPLSLYDELCEGLEKLPKLTDDELVAKKFEADQENG